VQSLLLLTTKINPAYMKCRLEKDRHNNVNCHSLQEVNPSPILLELKPQLYNSDSLSRGSLMFRQSLAHLATKFTSKRPHIKLPHTDSNPPEFGYLPCVLSQAESIAAYVKHIYLSFNQMRPIRLKCSSTFEVGKVILINWEARYKSLRFRAPVECWRGDDGSGMNDIVSPFKMTGSNVPFSVIDPENLPCP
jgi:hypothetical protein